MRSLRLLAPVAALLASTHLLAAPPAAAARPESLTPVIAAVKRQFASKSGVRFTAKSVERLVGIVTTSTSSGAYRLTASGVSASDVTEVDEEGRRFRLRTVGRASYTQDDRYDPCPRARSGAHGGTHRTTSGRTIWSTGSTSVSWHWPPPRTTAPPTAEPSKARPAPSCGER
ncbi:hypothetical protein ACFQ0B_49165 [Nonomuraea thailandensis]